MAFRAAGIAACSPVDCIALSHLPEQTTSFDLPRLMTLLATMILLALMCRLYGEMYVPWDLAPDSHTLVGAVGLLALPLIAYDHGVRATSRGGKSPWPG
jgi:hypothetical protein